MSIMKHRRIALNHRKDGPNAERFTAALQEGVGVTEVTYDKEKCVLNISYNLNMITFAQIENILANAGYTWPDSFLQRTKRSWIHFSEENELENAKAPSAPCCSHPDEILARNKRTVSH